MYETMMYTLRAFMGAGLLQLALFGAMALVIVALAAYSSASFRESFAALRAGKGWRGTAADLGTGLFKLAVVLLLARIFIATLNYQASVFGQEHGRITEQNRSAVLMKWGEPHEQGELEVSFTRKRTQVTRQLLVKQEKAEDRVIAETFWKDEDRPIQAVAGKLPVLLSTSEAEVDVPLLQKSLVSADVAISVANDPRRLGNANYAGYDDGWELKYVVRNKSPWPATAAMAMPLPANTGMFDRMYLRVDGADRLESAETGADNKLIWTVRMAPGEEKQVEFGYRSRGLEHLRYIPARMSQTGHYRVTMSVAGVPSAKLDYPIGSMPPAENLADLKSDPYTLTWNLDNAMTNYDIGVKLPVAEQPQYYFTDLLQQAPGGFLLLLALLLVPRIIAGKPVQVELIAILGALYAIHYILMARLADVMFGFAAPLLISAAVTVLLTAWLRRRTGPRDLLARQDPIAFALMAVAYPLAVIDSDRTGFWMVLFDLAMIAYACILLVKYRLLSKAAPLGPLAPAMV